MRSQQYVMGVFLTVALGATAVEAQQGRTRFRGMDVNRDGVITRSEWRGNARSFDVHDINQDGVLSGTEVSINDDRDPSRNRDGWDDLVDVFDSVDRNNNGVVSRDEWYGDRATFNRLDRDRNGVLRLSEFLGSNADPTMSDEWPEEQEPDRRDRRTSRSDDDARRTARGSIAVCSTDARPARRIGRPTAPGTSKVSASSNRLTPAIRTRWAAATTIRPGTGSDSGRVIDRGSDRVNRFDWVRLGSIGFDRVRRSNLLEPPRTPSNLLEPSRTS